VLFYTDKKAVKGMQEKVALYADRFPTWGTESTAMHQFAVWTALEQEGFGASLQHYNPLVDAKVASTWGVDEDWQLTSMLVFGTPVGGAGEKSFSPLEERVKVFGA
jgi:predicted oxidoreductase (fatty acid repression mutant protein)